MFLFVFLGMISTKYNDSIPYVYMILNESIYALVLLFIITAYMISNTISFKIFSFIGEISYSIYLFHMSVYLSVDKIFGYGMNSLSEFMLTLVFMSLFFVACSYIKGVAKIGIEHGTFWRTKWSGHELRKSTSCYAFFEWTECPAPSVVTSLKDSLFKGFGHEKLFLVKEKAPVLRKFVYF